MAEDVSQQKIRKVLIGILSPLARTLLRCGVSYLEFADIAKVSFVEAASIDYGVRDRPTSIARVAVMTGLSRREISRIRRQHDQDDIQENDVRRNLPAEVLEMWHTDPRFQDSNGNPRPLAIAGPGTDTFSNLVRLVTSDTPPRAMERELVRAGALMLTVGKRLLPTSRAFVPQSATEKLLEGLQYGLSRLIETIAYNADPENQKESRFQRIVHIRDVSEPDVRILRESLAAILASFARQIDDYLVTFNKQRATKKSRGPKYHLGIGLYYFDNSD